MRFSALLAEAGVSVRSHVGEADITAVVADSRRCAEGSCFVAVGGSHCDGHAYLSAALAAGAAAVLCRDASRLPKKRPPCYAVVDDTQEALGKLAQALHGWPARKMTCLAVTGTNGKSTVTHLVRSILAAQGHTVGLVGTIAYETPARTVPATMTTPDATVLASLMAEMVAEGATHLVMEVSSHALDQKRIAGVDFAAAAFTNLTGDHLDYHGTMDAYFAAKRSLFASLPPSASAVINRDDPYADAIASATCAPICWYGLSPLADVRGRIKQIDADGTVFDVLLEARTVRVRTPLIGRHNVFNSLAAVGLCHVLGVELDDIARALGDVRSVPGRLQRVPTGGDYQVFVDYAHTDDALQNVLSALRPITPGRIIVVFGCGGDRDATKRPRMAQVAQALADRIVVTSDNPRSEDPQRIIEEILAGLDAGARARTVVDADRRKAIDGAIRQARAGDVVLLAGKGHETVQVIGTTKIPFDDAEVAAECIREQDARGT